MNEFDHISDYFSGALTPEETELFDQKIRQDPAFAEEVAFYCNAIQEARSQLYAEKKNHFRQLYTTSSAQKKDKPVFFMQRWVQAAAAAIIIIAALAGWLLWPQAKPGEMADKFIQAHFYQLPNMMGEADSLQTAIALNNRNQLPEALAIFEKLAAADAKNETLIKYAGIVSLRLNYYDKALTYFSQLEEMKLQSNPGKFYKALTLLKRNLPGDKENAQQLLKDVIATDPENKEEAANIIHHL